MSTSKPLIAIILVCVAFPAHAWGTRSVKERAAFARSSPCPATHKHYGACPGYVIDHVVPLCAGGLDQRTNMQWQTRSDSYVKDAKERALCRSLHRH